MNGTQSLPSRPKVQQGEQSQAVPQEVPQGITQASGSEEGAGAALDVQFEAVFQRTGECGQLVAGSRGGRRRVPFSASPSSEAVEELSLLLGLL